jgi:hypothetical protein
VKNAAPYIRQQFYASISGVPVFEEGEALSEQEYVVIGNQSIAQANDKRTLADAITQTIEVVVVNKTKKRLDEIATGVMNQVSVPTNADFQVIAPTNAGRNYLTEKSITGDIIRRLIITYTFLIIQR